MDKPDFITKGKPQPPSKFLVIGDPFSGKTTLAAKAPRPLFISTDDNAVKAGLDAVQVKDLQTLKKAIDYFDAFDDYDTLVIDTIEGVADLFEKAVIEGYIKETGHKVTAMSDVPFGRLTGKFNKYIANLSEQLWAMKKNVIVLSYTKRQQDDVSGSIVLVSELKSIRHFTKFADAIIVTIYDGEKHEARVALKRAVMAGEVEYGPIEDFLKAAGWNLPTKKIKIGKAVKS
jgi:hypothetical protein